MMKSNIEFANIKNNVMQRHARVLSVSERYQKLVANGLIKEDGRKTAMPGEAKLDGKYCNSPSEK